MYVLHVALSISQARVGKLFSKDRTTVLHACAVVEDRRDDPCFDRLLDILERAAIELCPDGTGTDPPPKGTAPAPRSTQPRPQAGFSFVEQLSPHTSRALADAASACFPVKLRNLRREYPHHRRA